MGNPWALSPPSGSPGDEQTPPRTVLRAGGTRSTGSWTPQGEPVPAQTRPPTPRGDPQGEPVPAQTRPPHPQTLPASSTPFWQIKLELQTLLRLPLTRPRETPAFTKGHPLPVSAHLGEQAVHHQTNEWHEVPINDVALAPPPGSGKQRVEALHAGAASSLRCGNSDRVPTNLHAQSSPEGPTHGHCTLPSSPPAEGTPLLECSSNRAALAPRAGRRSLSL